MMPSEVQADGEEKKSCENSDDMIRLWWRLLLDLDVAQGSQFNGRLLINNWACTGIVQPIPQDDDGDDDG